MIPQPPPPDYCWEIGYQAYYHNPGSRYHGYKVVLAYRDPCGEPGWCVDIIDPKLGHCSAMAVDEKNLWIYN